MHRDQGALSLTRCPPSGWPLGWREGNAWPLRPKAGRGESRAHVPASVQQGAALLSQPSLIGVSHARQGRCALGFTGGGRVVPPRWQGPAAMAGVETAGAARRAQVRGTVEVRGHHSGAPHCASPWGDLGPAWGSGKPLWAGCSWLARLREE